MPIPDRKRFHFRSLPGPVSLPVGRANPLQVLARLRRRLDRVRSFRATLIVAALLAAAWIEGTTGWLQAVTFSTLNSSMHYRIEPGRSARIAFPREGPFDFERGYREVPEFSAALAAHRMTIGEQARFSNGLLMLTRLGIPLAYPDKPVAGLVIRDESGDTLFDAAARRRWFRSYGQIPEVVARSLTTIENRKLHARTPSTQNPAIDWGRLARATVLWTGRAVGLPLPVEGGSTLAVQLVKYRHGKDGRTDSPLDKLRQIAAASITAYRQGPDTRDARRQFLLDYLNTMPLAAVPGFGEVQGINDGLHAWFGLDPSEVWRTLESDTSAERRALAYKPVLALLCAAQAPSRFLRRDHAALERRVDAFAGLLEREGVIDAALARATRETPLHFPKAGKRAPAELPSVLRSEDKPAYIVRRDLAGRLGVPNFYRLDRLDLDVQTTLDDRLQDQVLALFRQLADSSFVAAHGLKGEHLLRSGDPARVRYSLILYESDPDGDHLCAQVDNLDAPFDLNTGMKLELGSTAKLRTLAHYLQIVDSLHQELGGRSARELAARSERARDPITRDITALLAAEPDQSLDSLLARSLQRRYSANPGEMFFTGGGAHVFHNFDAGDNGRSFSIRDGLVRSSNLVFVRLMRDVVRWHEARLPYDARAVMSGEDSATRSVLLRAAADDEARQILARAWRRMRGLDGESLEREMLGERPGPRSRAALFFAWHRNAGERELGAWLDQVAQRPEENAFRNAGVAPPDVPRSTLARVYGNPAFTLLDYAYLLRRHPLELWCAGELQRSPRLTFDELWARSEDARALCRGWLMKPGRVGAQNLRLRARIERDAFLRMTPAWRALGFPFEQLVPSYATALGASGDRPAALAQLMGIIVGDGIKRPALDVRRMVLAGGTPYHTAFEPVPQPGERVLSPEVAGCLRHLLGEVVSRGTARRVDGAFVDAASEPLAIGGKTGSGDNGRKLRSGWESTSRTATFAFYLGDRHYGVITATVWGKGTSRYEFTSSLPLAVLRLMAPSLSEHLKVAPREAGSRSRPPVAPVIAGKVIAENPAAPAENRAAPAPVARLF